MGSSAISVRFWGVRGSIATGEPCCVRYGGDTIAVEMRCGDHVLVFDAGSGVRSLGNALINEGHKNIDLFFSHAHFDHVEGLPFFHPFYHQGVTVEIWSGHMGRKGATKSFVQGLMVQPYFPVSCDVWSAAIRYHDFRQGTVLTPRKGLTLKTFALRHPGGATGYRLDHGGRSVCYITDNEHPEGGHDPALEQFVQKSDLVIYDAMYTDAEYPRYVGYGHSTWQEGVRMCKHAKVKQVAMIHHRPLRDDEALDAQQTLLDKEMPGSVFARQGMRLDI